MEYKFAKLFKWQSGKPITPTQGKIPIYGSNGIIGFTDVPKFENKIIIGRVGAYCGSVEYCKGIFNATDNTLVTTCNEDIIEYQYAYYLLKMFKLNNYAGGSAQPLVTQSILGHLKCSLPALPIQRRIASILSSYDNLIELNTRRIKLLEQMAENLYKEWFAFSKIKNNLEVVKLKSILSIVRGLSYSSSEIDCEDGVNLINLKNIKAYGGFRFDGTKRYNGKYKKEQIVKSGDLVMGVTDMTQDRRTVGSVALIPNIDGIAVITADLIKIESKIDNIFLFSMFKYGNISRHISQFANGANVLHLRPQAVENIRIYLPNVELINKYVSIVKPLFSEIATLQTQSANLTRQRDLLLPRLMSGQLPTQ